MKHKPLFSVEYETLPGDIQNLVKFKLKKLEPTINWVVGMESTPGANKVDEYLKLRGGFIGSAWCIWL